MTRELILIGRSRECHVRIDDLSVSRRHAELITAHDGRFFITDLLSGQGTFVHDGGVWKTIKQGYIDAATPVKLGVYETTARQLWDGATRNSATAHT